MFKYYTILLLSVLCFSSCSTYNLFQKPEELDIEVLNELIQKVQEPELRIGDKVSISVWKHDNISVGSINTVYNANEATGRWVVIDNTGEINLPKIGRVKLEGYNIKEATYYLEQLYSKEIVNPIVNIKVYSHNVTILGEVRSPGRYNISSDKTRLVEMIGDAQGMNGFADPRRIQLIRETDGKIQQINIDMTSIESLANQNYYIQPDDIIYVPPRKAKSFGEFTTKATPIAGILTSVAVFFSVFSGN